MSRIHLLSTTVLMGSALLLALPSASLAQVSPSQVPPGEAAAQPNAPTDFQFPAAGGLQAPAGADSIRFVLQDVIVEGQFDDLVGVSAQLAPTSGTEVSVADIYRFASRLQAAYFEAGYPLARVVVPPQDLDRETGTVRILVVSGFIQSVDSSALPARVRPIVARIMAPLVGRDPVSARALERQLLIAGEVAGLELRSALTPGDRTGATVLVLDGAHHAVQGAVSIDNRVSEDLGREQITASVSFNSLLGLGERIVATTAVAPDEIDWSDDAVRRYFSLYAEAPVSASGLMLGADLTYSTSTPRGASAALALQSEYVRFGAYASYPTIRSRHAIQTLRLGLDAAFEEQTTGILGFDVPLFTDRTRVVRLSVVGYAPTWLDGQVSYAMEASQGLDGLGARTADDASLLRPLSRFGADATFTRLTSGVTWAAPLGGPFSTLITTRGQTSFGDALLRSEQGSIISPDLVSGPPAGSLVGDSYVAGRIELQGTWGTSVGQISPYVFGAAGKVILERPLAFERGVTSASAVGAGVRINLPTLSGPRVSARLEWSQVDGDIPSLDRSWTTFSIVARF